MQREPGIPYLFKATKIIKLPSQAVRDSGYLRRKRDLEDQIREALEEEERRRITPDVPGRGRPQFDDEGNIIPLPSKPGGANFRPRGPG